MAAPAYYKVLRIKPQSTLMQNGATDPNDPGLLSATFRVDGPVANASEPWTLPMTDLTKGWQNHQPVFAPPVEGPLERCKNGYHVCTAEHLGAWYHGGPSELLFAVETSKREPVKDTTWQDPTKTVFRSIALVKHITPTRYEMGDCINLSAVRRYMAVLRDSKSDHRCTSFDNMHPEQRFHTFLGIMRFGPRVIASEDEKALHRAAKKSYQGWLRRLRHRGYSVTVVPG